MNSEQSSFIWQFTIATDTGFWFNNNNNIFNNIIIIFYFFYFFLNHKGTFGNQEGTNTGI